jgi:hypothetical protein
MAITINGSANTVAGLAVGGLPDGVVDADTLASNAVTNVKVADDAIGVAELSTTGTAGSGNYLRGDNAWTAVAEGGINKANIVQVSADTAFSTSSTSYVTNLTGSITPATGSYVMILCEGPETIYRRTGTTIKIFHQIERGTALSGTSLYENCTYWYGFEASNQSETSNRFYMSWIDTAPGGDGSTAITYSWNVKNTFLSTSTASNNYLNQTLTTKGRNMYLIEVK